MAVGNKVATSLQRFKAFPTLTLMCFGGLFQTIPWGFTSFSSEALQKYEGFTLTEVGYLLPTMSICILAGNFFIGIIARRVPHKPLLVGSCLIEVAGCILIVFIENYFAVLSGYILFGLGYASWIIIPYNQMSLLLSESEYPFFYTAYEVCRAVIAAGGSRLIMIICSTAIETRWGWRLPWVFIGCANAFTAFLIFSFGSFASPQQGQGKKNEADEHSYLEKVKGFYFHPIAIFLFLATGACGFGFIGLAVWAPTIAKRSFGDDYSENQIAVTMGIASLILYPLGVTLASLVLHNTHGRLEFTLKWSVFFFLTSVVSSWLVTAATHFYFYTFVYLITLTCLFFPLTAYKVLPELLELPPDITVFALSRLGMSFALFGDILGVLVTSTLVDEYGTDTTLMVMAIVISVGCAMWCVPSFWAWRDAGPVRELREAREAKDKAVADSAWAVLRNAARFSNGVRSNDQSQMSFRKVVRMVLIANAFEQVLPEQMLSKNYNPKNATQQTEPTSPPAGPARTEPERAEANL